MSKPKDRDAWNAFAEAIDHMIRIAISVEAFDTICSRSAA